MGSYVAAAAVRSRHRLHHHPHHRGRPGRLSRRARPVPADRRAGLPVGEPRDHRAAAAGPGGRPVHRLLRTHSRRAQLDLRPGSRRRGPGAEDPAPAGRHFKRDPHYPKGHHRARHRRGAHRPGGDQRLRPADARLLHQWAAHHRDGAPPLYPEHLRDEIDEVAQRIYTEVNNGVYRCGFAGSQGAYERAYDRLFTALDWLSERLAGGATWWATPSPRPTCDCSPRWPASTRSSATSSATAPNWPSCRCCGRTPATCSRPGFRRHRRLRPDQAALLHRACRHRPTRIVPKGGSANWLTPAGSVGRQAIRRWNAAGVHPRGERVLNQF